MVVRDKKLLETLAIAKTGRRYLERHVPERTQPDRSLWDFRVLAPMEVEFAVRYEYGRESKSLIAAVTDWHRRSASMLVAGDVLRREYLGQYVTWTVGELIKRFNDLPPEVARIIKQGTPHQVVDALGPLVWRFPEFPEPFLKIAPQLRQKRIQAIEAELQESPRWDAPLCMFDWHTTNHDAITSRTNNERDRGIGYYVARIDWRYSKNAIKAEFLKWLAAEKPLVKRSKGKAGKAAASTAPLNRLKWLAANRLAERGFSHQDARAFSRQLLERAPVSQVGSTSPAEVLPDYGSKGAWDNALTDYRNFRRKILGPWADKD